MWHPTNNNLNHAVVDHQLTYLDLTSICCKSAQNLVGQCNN